MKIEIELYHTSETLPANRQYVHWLTPNAQYWASGYYNACSGKLAPGFFQSHSGALYVCDEHTWWTHELPILPMPEEEE